MHCHALPCKASALPLNHSPPCGYPCIWHPKRHPSSPCLCTQGAVCGATSGTASGTAPLALPMHYAPPLPPMQGAVCGATSGTASADGDSKQYFYWQKVAGSTTQCVKRGVVGVGGEGMEALHVWDAHPVGV